MNFNSNLKSNLNTDGRTDGLTKNQLARNSQLAVPNAHAHTSDSMVQVGEVLNGDRLWMTQERHDVLRTGEREVIPAHIRSAVWYRDRGKCEHCQAPTPEGMAWHLDHIVPWSAGGSDDSTNLRVLCERHNLDRGNRIDPDERPRRPITWWCANCYDGGAGAWHYDGGMPWCPTHRGHLFCRVLNGYEHAHKLTGQWPTWHKRSAMEDPTKIAYCAHCDAPGVTDVVL